MKGRKVGRKEIGGAKKGKKNKFERMVDNSMELRIQGRG